MRTYIDNRFKFRVWDINARQYDYEHVVGISPSGNLLTPYGGYSYTSYQKPHVVEYSTGLLDKNGKLIYEGDVVRYSYTDTTGHIVQFESSVIWYRGGFCLQISKSNTMQAKYSSEFWAEHSEVIGNIHELEKAKHKYRG